MITFNSKQLRNPISGSFQGNFTGNLTGTASFVVSSSMSISSSFANQALSSSYALVAQTLLGSVVSASYALTASYAANASSSLSAISASQALSSSYAINSNTASYSLFAVTASNAPNYLPLTGGTINGNVIINGTASISVLNVSYESASVIYSSGSNQFGDASNDVQTFWGTVDVKTGPVLVTGSLNVSGGITGSLFGTSSWATNAITASYVSSNFQYEIHVSQVDGNDTTGNGDLLKPVATIGKALLIVSASVASTDRRTIIVHPGTYIENITVNTTNTYFFSTGLLGANCLISGSVTVSAATRMSGLKMTNLIVSSSAPVYINNCAVDKQMTVSGSGYLEVQNTSLQCTSGIQVVGPASSGVIFENCSLYPLTVNNASAAVYIISCNQAITPTLTAGALTITRSTISSLTSGATSTALTTAAGSVLVLESCNVYNSLLTSHAAITANGFYSIKNIIYNRSASTLASLSGTGGPLATVTQFQYINADNINSTQGLTVTGSILTTGSITLVGNQTITGSLLVTAGITGSFSGSGANLSNIPSSAITGLNLNQISSGSVSASISPNNGLQINTNVTATSFTGSLFGTASYASNGGVTQLLAGPNISLSPTTGLGQVTISSTGGGFNTATGSYGSFYSTQTQTNVASTARSMSLNTTDISNGVSVSGSTNPFNTYIKTENAGVYDIQFSAQVDKTDSGTDEIWIWLRKNGTDLTDTATSLQLVGNGAHYVAAWNFFVNAAANDYFQLIWYSPDANVRLHAEPAFGIVPGIPSLIVTVNRVDQFMSNTGSFQGTFTGDLIGTASFATTSSYTQNALSASYALTASYALNGGGGGSGNGFPFTGTAEITGSLIVSTNVQIDGSLIDYSSINSSIVGSNNLYQIATGSYTAAFTKYTLRNGANARAGEFVTVWNGTTVVNYDNSTTDIGNTADVTFTSAIVTSQIKIDAVTTTSAWTIKSTTTFI